MPPPPWRISIDTGGTFTDGLALDPRGALHRAKVLSSGALRGRIVEPIDPTHLRVSAPWPAVDDFVRGFRFRLLGRLGPEVRVAGYEAGSSLLELDEPPRVAGGAGAAFEVRGAEPAPVLVARMVTRTPAAAPLPPATIRLATTRGTNALLERRGAPTALFITRGFGDLLEIGDQQRPDLFALHIQKTPPLYERVFEVDERLAADGSVLRPLEPGPVAAEAKCCLAAGVRVAAVALLHAYLNPEHEQALARLLVELGFEHVSCSSSLSPLIKIVPRAETAVINAYLAPLIESYLAQIVSAVPGGRLHVMTSAGGLVGAGACRAKDGLLSGPAGGVAGAAAAARRSGFARRVISFDMGGTSTDVARYDGDFEYQFEHRVAGARLVAPALAIETVAAGGGSICSFSDRGLRVGPESAQAVPGPACYGAGGPLTLTDVNLLLGRLDPGRFEIPISVERAEAALAEVGRAVAEPTGAPPEREVLLEGFLRIANERMGDAIAEVSLRRGYDPSDHVLVAFGGAGGQHACAVAGHLGIETILMPADASLLSALGLGGAVIERFAQRQVLRPLAEVSPDLRALIDELAAQAVSEVAGEGVAESQIVVRRRIVNLRLQGQETSIAVEADRLEAAFAERYEAMYGHRPQGPIEVESIRVVASSRPPAPDAPPAAGVSDGPAVATRRQRCCFDGGSHEVPVHERGELRPGDTIGGPALVFDAYTACVVEPGWTARVDGAGALVLRREAGAVHCGGESRPPDVVRRELFTNRFLSIARQMGRMLERTALSTNVKERLDFSCALLDADGELVVHAPHMPVHLGSLGLCVRAVRDAVAMAPGDVVVTNHPAFGGSHLPDITVVTPVHGRGGLLGYVASRAHHAEIGGTRPGSMPPLAKSLAEEGVVLAPAYLIRAGEARFAEIERQLAEAPYPSRAIGDNLADLRAAVAANHRGATALGALAEAHGDEVIAREMAAIKARAEAMARRALLGLSGGPYQATEHLDDGSPICVTIDLAGDRAVIDFSGTAGQHPGNLNATPAVVRSAVIYVLRLMIGEALPLNEGIMRAVEVVIPPGMLNPDFPDDPRQAPAVAGGNVETSQRIVDTLLKALRICAGSQGTMNNVLFGTRELSYYETVCGGSGAGPGFDGADAVHTHMTNTRITDPELLERRYPVRLERFAIRRGSGGRGEHQGGDGAVRELTFLEPMSLSILSQHRTEGPYGLAGGEPGAPGSQRLVRADGRIEALGSIDAAEVGPGDRLVLETPGGGGYGSVVGGR